MYYSKAKINIFGERKKSFVLPRYYLVLGLKQFLAFETNNVKCCSSKINFLWILAHFSLICCQHLMTITIHLMTITIQKRQPIWGSQFKYAQAQQYHSQSHRNEQTHNLNKWYYNLFVWNIRFEFFLLNIFKSNSSCHLLIRSPAC